MNRAVISYMLLALLVGCNQEDNIVWVYGDSITAYKDSWAYQMHEADAATVRNMAIPGATWRDTTVWEGMRCDNQESVRRKVVVALGSNDALWLNTHDVYPHVVRNLEILAAKGCDTYVILPAEVPPFVPLMIPERWESVRQQIIQAAQAFDVPTFEVIIDWSETYDGLHPTSEEQGKIGMQIGEILDLAWRGTP